MFCDKCGKQIPNDSTFCEFCGASIVNADGPPPDAPPTAPPSPPTTYAAPPRPARPSGYQRSQPAGYAPYAPPHPKKKTGLIVTIVLLCVLLLGAGGFLAWTYFGQGEDQLAGQMDEDLSEDIENYSPISANGASQPRDGSGGPDPSESGEAAQTERPAENPTDGPTMEPTETPPPTPDPTPPPVDTTLSGAPTPADFGWYINGGRTMGLPMEYVQITDLSLIFGDWKMLVWIDPDHEADSYGMSYYDLATMNIDEIGGVVTMKVQLIKRVYEDGTTVDLSFEPEIFNGGYYPNGKSIYAGESWYRYIISDFFSNGGKQFGIGGVEYQSGEPCYVALVRP